MDVSLRCRCGQLTGHLASPHRAARAICYCRDCQGFARFLGQPEAILNGFGGTDIVATCPRFVHFSNGQAQLRCMSLSPNGLLRWYAGCCRTPIGNTPRDPKVSYVGLVSTCLGASPGELDAEFGPAKVAINTASASGPVASTPLASFAGVIKIIGNVLGSRLSGKYRDNPFFRPGSAESIAVPQVLALAERRSLRGDA